MDINIPEVLRSDLWRNKLIEFYLKYWSDLQNLPLYRFETLTSFVETLEKIVTNIRSNSEVSHISSSPQAKTIRKLENDTYLLKKQMGEIEDRIDYFSDKEAQSAYSELKSILQILEIFKTELINLKVEIITHPNNEVEFLDTETKFSLKTAIEEEPKS
jgi:hypothetical protein